MTHSTKGTPSTGARQTVPETLTFTFVRGGGNEYGKNGFVVLNDGQVLVGCVERPAELLAVALEKVSDKSSLYVLVKGMCNTIGQDVSDWAPGPDAPLLSGRDSHNLMVKVLNLLEENGPTIRAG